MKMKKFAVYLEDSAGVIKVAIPAENEKAAQKYVEGNGEVIAIKDITEKFPISTDYVAKALKKDGFGQIEIDLITRALSQISITE